MSKTFHDWDELSDHLRTLGSKFGDISSSTHRACRMGFQFKDDVLGVFFVHNPTESGSSWVFVGVRIQPASRFDLVALMNDKPDGPIGALSLARDYLCLGHNLPIRGLTSETLQQTLEQLCEAALWVRSRETPEPEDHVPFAYLAD